ncbi:MAG: winged helix-turn-helix transcriptional regulator [Chloroflexi bacterium]|nr:winged helix-turn-helix transcriptional regulator [Chloroflexota bacterium]
MTDTLLEQDPDRQSDELPLDLEAYVAGLVNAVEKGMAAEVAPHGLSPLEFHLLRYCMDGERTATQLAEVLPVDGSRVSRLVTGLVDKGMLRRRRLRSDRRVVMLRLSDEGRELTTRIVENMRGYDAMLTAGIGAEDLSVFASVSARIIANHAAMDEAE